MNDFQRDFKGIWIPREIWLDTRLNALDKMIYAEINSLDCDGEGCYASNEYIAEFCQCSERKVSDSITRLKDCGYICVKAFNGRQRVLSSNLVLMLQNCEADSQNLRGRVAKSARQSSKICEQRNIVENYNRDNLNNKERVDYLKITRDNAKSTTTTLDSLDKDLDTFCRKFGIGIDNYGPRLAQMDFKALTERFEESEWLKANVTSFKKICDIYPRIISGYYKDYNRKPKGSREFDILQRMLKEAEEEEEREKQEKGESDNGPQESS